MKIYFAGSIRGGRQDVHIYHDIIKQLREGYGEVLTEFVGDKNINEKEGTANKTDKEIHDDDVAMLSECNCEYCPSMESRYYFLSKDGKYSTVQQSACNDIRWEQDFTLGILLRAPPRIRAPVGKNLTALIRVPPHPNKSTHQKTSI